MSSIPIIAHPSIRRQSTATRILFDGEDDYIEIDADADFEFVDDFAISHWVNFLDVTGPKYSLEFLGLFESPQINISFDWNDGIYGLWVFWNSGGGGANRVRTTVQYDTGADVNVILTRLSGTVFLYVNGTLIGGVSYGDPMGSASQPIRIGKGQLGTPFCGQIWDLRVWSGKGLNSTEVNQIYSGDDIETGLILQAPLLPSNPTNLLTGAYNLNAYNF